MAWFLPLSQFGPVDLTKGLGRLLRTAAGAPVSPIVDIHNAQSKMGTLLAAAPSGLYVYLQGAASVQGHRATGFYLDCTTASFKGVGVCLHMLRQRKTSFILNTWMHACIQQTN